MAGQLPHSQPNDPSSPPPLAAAPVRGARTKAFWQRFLSTIMLWALVAAALASMNPWAHLGLMAALAIGATAEFFWLSHRAGLHSNRRWGLVLAVLYCGSVCWFFGTGHRSLPTGLDVLLFFLLVVGSFSLQLRHHIVGSERIFSLMTTVLGVTWLTWLFLFMARLDFAVAGAGPIPGMMLLLWCIAVTKFTDMGAYLIGTLCGKHKMIPHISPGKTWEGFIGAIGFAQLAGCSLYALQQERLAMLNSWPHVIFLGLILALLAVLGDLAESLWKRSITVKDSGHVLPGIGGFMDLIDSLCFTAPALWLYVTLFLT